MAETGTVGAEIAISQRPDTRQVIGQIETTNSVEIGIPRSDLQAAMLCAKQGFTPDKNVISEKLQQATVRDRFAWTDFKTISDQDRRDGVEEGRTARTNDEWAQKFQEWGRAISNDQTRGVQLRKILQAIGVSNLNDNDTSLKLLTEYANHSEGMQKFVEVMVKTYVTESISQEAKDVLLGVSQGLFGRVGSEVILQALYLEKTIQQRSINERDKLVDELVQSGTKPSTETRAFVQRMKNLLAKSGVSSEIKVDTKKDISATPEVTGTERVAIVTDQGNREKQQDYIFAQEGNLPRGIKALVIVADGHGTENGEKVSTAAGEAFKKHMNELVSSDPSLSIAEAMKRAIAATDEEVSQIDPNAGTTFTVAMQTAEGEVFIAHVGDSPAYQLKDRKITKLTTDHHWPGGGYEHNLAVSRSLGDMQARKSGPPEFSAQPDMAGPIKAVDGNILILGSDGINVLSQEEIATIVSSKSPKDAVRDLQAAVKKKIGTTPDADNFSIAVLKLT